MAANTPSQGTERHGACHCACHLLTHLKSMQNIRFVKSKWLGQNFGRPVWDHGPSRKGNCVSKLKAFVLFTATNGRKAIEFLSMYYLTSWLLLRHFKRVDGKTLAVVFSSETSEGSSLGYDLYMLSPLTPVTMYLVFNRLPSLRKPKSNNQPSQSHILALLRTSPHILGLQPVSMTLAPGIATCAHSKVSSGSAAGLRGFAFAV